jgi:hypothetical protein
MRSSFLWYLYSLDFSINEYYTENNIFNFGIGEYYTENALYP